MTAEFAYLNLTELRPEGWLLDQLRAQADGITGRLEELWPDVGPSSGWLGGQGECWERGPYYVAGLLPLAELLDDDALRAKTAPWIEWTLASQRDDGFFGPAHNRDWWPRMVMLPVLVWHHAATGDERVPPFVERYLGFAHDTLPDQPLEMWAAARGAELIPTVLWCHERTGHPWLLDLARLLIAQSIDWRQLYRDFPYPEPAASYVWGRFLRAYLPPRTAVEEWVRRWRPAKRTRVRTAAQIAKANSSAPLSFYHRTHGVNHAMALRGVAYAAMVTGNDPHAAALLAHDVVQRYHGSAVGVVTADEHLAGRSPVHGIETCTVVETMRSFEELLRITGDGSWADRLDEVGLNALPAALTPDLSGHQYYQQVNQIEVSRRRRPWFNGGRDGTLFGLEPTYGCCTANLHQGWPRLAASAVMRSLRDDGLVVTGLLPVRVRTEVAGSIVSLQVQSEYPFDGRVRVVVSAAQPTTFPLRLRVPGWARDVRLSVNGSLVEPRIERGFAVLTREWGEAARVELELPMPVRSTTASVTGESPDDGVVLRRGPLVLALDRPEQWSACASRWPVPDWEVRSRAPWAFALDPASVGAAEGVMRGGIVRPFDHARPAVSVRSTARPILDWTARHGSVGPLPAKPTLSPSVPIRLVPYGASAVRMTVFPKLPREIPGRFRL